MRRKRSVVLVAPVLFAASLARGQDPPERVRVFCDRADPRNNCPGPDCFCVDETLEVTFDGDSDSVLEYTKFEPNAPIETTVVMHTVSDKVQGWSYAVEHDPEVLTLMSVTTEGTEADWSVFGGFIWVDMTGIQACAPDDPRCKNPVPGAGYLSASIIVELLPKFLSPGRNRICKATYALRADPGPAGTLIRCVDNRFKKTGSPPVPILLTVDGGSREPARLIDGWIRPAPQQPAFLRGDADGSGRVNVVDAIAHLRIHFEGARPRFDCDRILDATGDERVDISDPIRLLEYVFLRGPDLPAPFPQCGVEPAVEQGTLACAESNCTEN